MYRERKRYGQDPDVVVRSSDKTFYAPLTWDEPKRIMVCSWSDFFIKEADPWREDVIQIMHNCPLHTFIIPTKRPEQIFNSLIRNSSPSEKWGNVWFLASIENQEAADKRIPELLKLREHGDWPVLGISAEPLLGAIDITPYIQKLDWVITGGESGTNAWPCHPDWIRGLRDQCLDAGVPFFFKQWGEWAPKRTTGIKSIKSKRWGVITEKGEYLSETTPWNGHDDDGSGEAVVVKVGKKAAGRLIDGREWNQFPEKRDDKKHLICV